MKKLLLISLATIAMASCASRHKEVQKQVSKFDFSAQVDTSSHFKEQLQLAATSNLLRYLKESNMQIDYDGQEGDSLSVEQFGPDGQLLSKTKISGKGKAKISSGEKKEQVEEKSKSDLNKESDLKASGTTKINADAFEETLDKTVDKKGFTFGGYIWLFLLVLILSALYYLNKRFGWLKSLKNHITTNKS